MNIAIKAILAILSLCVANARAADPQTGPVIEGFGPVYEVPEGSFNLVPGKHYKVLMDISKGPDDPSKINRGIESAARFLNMHARNGIAAGDLSLAIVLHGSATRSALNDEAHAERFEAANGSKALIRALADAGADIYVCGQSAAHHGFGAEELLPEVRMAVSAMTVHVRLQEEGYHPILF